MLATIHKKLLRTLLHNSLSHCMPALLEPCLFPTVVFSLTLVLPAPGDLLHLGRPAKKTACFLTELIKKLQTKPE